MWDTIETLPPEHEHLSRDRPCAYCHHAAHFYLPCDAACGCQPGS
jgi:hypothetical protein